MAHAPARRVARAHAPRGADALVLLAEPALSMPALAAMLLAGGVHAKVHPVPAHVTEHAVLDRVNLEPVGFHFLFTNRWFTISSIRQWSITEWFRPHSRHLYQNTVRPPVTHWCRSEIWPSCISQRKSPRVSSQRFFGFLVCMVLASRLLAASFSQLWFLSSLAASS